MTLERDKKHTYQALSYVVKVALPEFGETCSFSERFQVQATMDKEKRKWENKREVIE